MYEYFAEVKRIVDGDTFELLVDVGFHVQVLEVFRLRNFDTPETWCPRNEAERRHGKNATKFVKKLLKSRCKIHVYRQGYYKRYIADVFVETSNGEWFSLADSLKIAGFAKQSHYPNGEMEPTDDGKRPIFTG